MCNMTQSSLTTTTTTTITLTSPSTSKTLTVLSLEQVARRFPYQSNWQSC